MGDNHEHDSPFKSPGIFNEVDGLAWPDVDMHCLEFTLPNIMQAKRARSHDTRSVRVYTPVMAGDDWTLNACSCTKTSQHRRGP